MEAGHGISYSNNNEQSLELSEIEAIVTKIEQEKEAGMSACTIVNATVYLYLCRCREKTFKTCGDCCGSSRHEPARGRSFHVIGRLVILEHNPCISDCLLFELSRKILSLTQGTSIEATLWSIAI